MKPHPSTERSDLGLAIDAIQIADTHEHLGLRFDDPLEGPRLWARPLSPTIEDGWIGTGPSDVLEDLFLGTPTRTYSSQVRSGQRSIARLIPRPETLPVASSPFGPPGRRCATQASGKPCV